MNWILGKSKSKFVAFIEFKIITTVNESDKTAKGMTKLSRSNVLSDFNDFMNIEQ